MSDLAPILQGFFRVKLMQHKDASPHTIASYRDTWRLLLHYAQQATGDPAKVYAPIAGAAAMGLVAVGLVSLLDVGLRRYHPREAAS